MNITIQNLFINFAKIVEILAENPFPENKIGEILRERNQTLSTAESCTGGLISSFLTDISGSSEYIFSNFVTYSNEAKMKYLGVKSETLEKHGAVSEQTAREMAEGLLKVTGTTFAMATTGIAGPTGGSDEKPVGLMFIGLSDGINTKVIEVLEPSVLQRRLMKLAFAKDALQELYLFIK